MKKRIKLTLKQLKAGDETIAKQLAKNMEGSKYGDIFLKRE